MWSIWGAPIYVVMYIAMLGSVLLLVASAVMLLNRKIGIRVALLATILLWSFYLPAAVETYWPYIGQDGLYGAAAACSLLLLLGVTAYSVFRLFRPEGTNGS